MTVPEVSGNYTDKYLFTKLPKRNNDVRPYAFCMGFQERLKEARKAAGLTGEKLGELIGCSKQNISHWEAGRFEPNIDFLIKLCQALDVSMDWLVLGKAQEQLSAGALRQARYFDALSPDKQRRWDTLRMLLSDGASDATVENRMPVTKSPPSAPPSGAGSYKKITPIPETAAPGKRKKET